VDPEGFEPSSKIVSNNTILHAFQDIEPGLSLRAKDLLLRLPPPVLYLYGKQETLLPTSTSGATVDLRPRL